MTIDMTYNFFSTPVLLVTLAYFIKKWISDTQTNAAQRNADMRASLSKIDACMVAMKIELERKVPRPECDTVSGKLWERLHEIEQGGMR